MTSEGLQIYNGYRTNFNRFKEAEEATDEPEYEQNICKYELKNPMISSLQQNPYMMLSQKTDNRSSEYQNAESDSYQEKSSTVLSMDTSDDNSSFTKHQKELGYWGLEDAWEGDDARVECDSVKPFLCSTVSDSLDVIAKQGNELVKELSTHAFYGRQTFGIHVLGAEEWEFSCAVCKEDKSDTESNLTSEKRSSQVAAQCLLDSSVRDEGLKKNDSFSRWMSKELEDVEPVVPSCSGAYWDVVDDGSDCPSLSSQAELDPFTLGPSLSQDQLFRIIDFSPSWGYVGSETKVLIAGKFLKAQQGIGKCQWSCMFGEVEVPAEVIADGVLRCNAPQNGVGRVPFYVTCSNRLACSEVKEFEYRGKFNHALAETSLGSRCEVLQIRLGKLLSLGSGCPHNSISWSLDNGSHLCNEISSLLNGSGDEWLQLLKLSAKDNFSLVELKEQLAERLLKEKLCEWLLYKEAEGGNGPRVLDEDGQSVLHLAAALGYDWAISPTVTAGVNINFRDVRGWTALHWAASYGREHTVVLLISLGASAGALTDPTPTYPMGRTAADLASENGHKGIAGYLAESALTAHLVSLTLNNKNKEGHATEHSGVTSVITASERIATAVSDGDNIDRISLKDSLAAVRNASQAAAQIYQVYRVQSFQRKQIRDFVDEQIGKSHEHALSVVTMKTHKHGQHDEPVQAAAVRIQNKFRSWKGRKEFLTIRQRIVKIQALVRGHQVRKNYRKFVWSVGILEKVILRWRRKGSGLRGFRPGSQTGELNSEGISSKEDDYDFLKKGRQQAEERQQKALSRVKSMIKYPEARDQYRRLLTTATEIKEMKGKGSSLSGGSDVIASINRRIDAGILLDDGTFMSSDC